MRKFLQTVVVAMFFMLAALPAWALGLGQLQVKSRLNEPLLAEIPVISSDPAELENLQARLASPDTFLRVGLPLPDTLVSDLRFAVAYDADNKPVIRVTSAGPVRLPAWTFLVEVEWGQGKLVREYSVLLATPEAVANAPVPPVALPAPPASAVINRPLPANPAPASAPAPVATPAAAAPAGSPMAAGAQAPRLVGEVRPGQTLSQIGAAIRRPGQDLGALMAALLEYNPDAFIGGDIDRLRSGARLSLPASMVRDDAVAAFAADAAARAGAATPRPALDLANDVPPAPRASRAGGTRTSPVARLEIVPAATGKASSRVAGTGGEGDVQMNQQLQEARETVAARDAEVQELKARVDSLEALQKQQSQLLQMKDTALAAAQQQLRERQTRPEPAAQQASSPAMIAAWAIPLALVLLALTYWAGRRGRRGTGTVRAQGDAPSFVAADASVREAPALFRESPMPTRSGLDRPSWLRGRGDATAGDGPAAGEVEPDMPAEMGDPAFADAAPAHGDERLALARTYLELDDRATARRLLQAVAAEGDLASASQARAMLDRLG